MMSKKSIAILLGLGSFSLSVFALPNPAAQYCVKEGGKYEVRKASNSDQYGICKFKDSECGEWSFFRHSCDEGDCLVVRELPDIFNDGTTHLFCVNEDA